MTVENVLADNDGIFKNAKKGTMILDTSTINPLAAKTFYKMSKKYNMVYLDTPV